MKRLELLTIMLVLIGCGRQEAVKYQPGNQNAASGQTLSWAFDVDPTGKPPSTAAIFSGVWEVRSESGTPSAPNALCQTGNATFPALTLGDTIYADVTLSTHFKAISGQTDQAAGLIFRVQDQDNYYILRANALEGNVNLYKYAGGQRSEIKGGSGHVVSGQWQALRVEVTGNRFRGYLDDELIAEAADDTFQAGKIGLWTKADSVTCFDDVTAQAP